MTDVALDPGGADQDRATPRARKLLATLRLRPDAGLRSVIERIDAPEAMVDAHRR